MFSNFIGNFFNERRYLNNKQAISEQNTNFSQVTTSSEESSISTHSSFASYLSKSQGGLNLKENATRESSFLFTSFSNYSGEFLKYEDRNIDDLKFVDYLEKTSFLKIYVLVELKKKFTAKYFKIMNENGFQFVKKAMNKNLNKEIAIFYVKYQFLKRAKQLSFVKNIYILKSFVAEGYYRLKVIPQKNIDKVEFFFHLPYSKPGRKLLMKEISIFRSDGKVENIEEDSILKVYSSLRKEEPLVFFCKFKYFVDLGEMMRHDINVVGHDVFLEDYKKQVSKDPMVSMFTSFSDKIMKTKYVDKITSKIPKKATLVDIWKAITRELNQDIRYDWKKRRLFFSGSLPYVNIQDMYLTTEEIGRRKLGACPERSSLEAAILRNLGIPARTVTRLYHIYVEVYFPKIGWVSTSCNTEEIPLCQSLDEKQSYFVSWKPEHPIRLKWEGVFYPSIFL